MVLYHKSLGVLKTKHQQQKSLLCTVGWNNPVRAFSLCTYKTAPDVPLWILGLSGLPGEVQASQGYFVGPCLRKKKGGGGGSAWPLPQSSQMRISGRAQASELFNFKWHSFEMYIGLTKNHCHVCCLFSGEALWTSGLALLLLFLKLIMFPVILAPTLCYIFIFIFVYKYNM